MGLKQQYNIHYTGVFSKHVVT